MSQRFLLQIIFISLINLSCSTNYKYIAKRGVASDKALLCVDALKPFLEGASFLHNTDSTLHTRQSVRRLSNLERPRDKIAFWLKSLEGKYFATDNESRLRNIEALRRFYYRKYIIKPENVPESYFDLQKRILKEQGHGDIDIDDKTKASMIENIISDQKESLDIWFDYFLKESDSDVYPVWVKFWSLEGLLKLGVYNRASEKFSKRATSTVAPFPELNREAFAMVVELILRNVDGDSLDEIPDDFSKKLIASGASFGRIYARQLKLLSDQNNDILNNTEGIWRKYKRGENPDELVDTLKGKGTGWCTASRATAKSQLEGGDFFIYYSKDNDGEMTNPRIAIRMEGDKIAEVRGVAENQNIDKAISETDILSNKLRDFGEEGVRYQKRVDDMRLLTVIETKHQKNVELSSDELRFLYEIDHRIDGFGYNRDPRIKKILDQRNARKDISMALGIKESEISFTLDEALAGNIKFHYGTLDLGKLDSLKGVKLPKIISGDFKLYNIKSIDDTILPDRVIGNLDLSSVNSISNTKLPESVEGDMFLYSLKSMSDLIFPRIINGNLNIELVVDFENVTFPEIIAGDFNLEKTISLKGVKLPYTVQGNLILSSLKSIDRINMPREVNGDIDLSSLEVANELVLPSYLGGGIKLSSLVNANGLVLPKKLNGDLDLSYLDSADGLILPDELNGSLDLSSLKDLKSLRFPSILNGNLNLGSLRYAEELELPRVVNSLSLKSLRDAHNVTFPKVVNGDLLLNKLSESSGVELPEIIKGDLNIMSLFTLQGMTLPREVGRVISVINVP